MEKQFWWANKLGRAEPPGISKVSQTVLARLIESQTWHLLANSVRQRFSKGTMVSSAHLDVRHHFLLCATGAFQAATVVLEFRGSESESESE